MTRCCNEKWAAAPLGELLEILDSQRVPVNAEERLNRPGTIPYYGATGQVGWIDDFLFDEELVLLGEDGAPFLQPDKPKAYVIQGKSWVNNHAHVLRSLGSTPSRFWKYQLDQVDYRAYVGGTTRLKLSQAPMRQISLAVPPLREQFRIADAMDSYGSRLAEAEAELERVRRNLKRYRAAVLQAAVEGRLVPTEAALARAEGRDYEPALDLLKRILAERRRRWEQAELKRLMAADKPPKDDNWKVKYEEPARPHASGLPGLPEGWCWATVDQISRGVIYGSSAKTANHTDGAVPVLRMGNILDGELNYERLKYLPPSHPEFPALFLEPGDLLFNRTNSAELVGKSAVYVGSPSPCSFASYLMVVRFLSGVSAECIAAYLNSPSGRQWVASVAAQQVGQANVNGTKLRACPVPLAPEAEQRRIQTEMGRLLSVAKVGVWSATQNQRRSSRLRQSILKWAFEGKLVDQDPNDEPAEKLLERIRTERAAAAPLRKARIRRAKAAS